MLITLQLLIVLAPGARRTEGQETCEAKIVIK